MSIGTTCFSKKKEIYYKVAFREIAYIRSNDNYCEIQTTTYRHYSLRVPISKLEAMLPADLFLRAHRQYIVQTRLIDEIHPADGMVKLLGVSIPFSRENKIKIEAMLQ